jgi:DNA-binding MarR family transcriptional regulator
MASERLDDEVFHVMRRVMQKHTSRWQEEVPELTKAQYAVLRAVGETPGIEQGALVDAAASSKATLTEMLLRLEKRGLVVRHARADDKRRREVELTPAGKELLSRSLRHVEQVDTGLLDRLPPHDRAELLRILRTLAADE